MAETPQSYFPDMFVDYSVRGLEDFATEMLVSRSGREQRRSLYSTQYRRWTAGSDVLTRVQRLAVRSFLRTQKGKFGAFYFWNPFPESQQDVSAGSVTAQPRIIIPYRMTNASGTVIGSLTDVRVAGVTLTFTSRSLLPRSTTYAALRFVSASTTYIDCGTSTSLRNAGDFTVAAWVYVTVQALNLAIASNYTANASGFMFWLDSLRQLNLTTGFASSNTTVTSTSTVAAGQWYHVAAAKSANSVTFFINGVAVAGGGSVTDQAVATANFWIGQATSANPNISPFDGMLSDVRYYKFALAAAEILNLYQNKTPPTPAYLLAGWWKITEGTGTIAANSSGNQSNNGTLINSPTWVSGEEEVTFTSGVQTGAVTVWGELRERVVARSDMDSLAYAAFQGGAPDYEVFQLALKEVF